MIAAARVEHKAAPVLNPASMLYRSNSDCASDRSAPSTTATTLPRGETSSTMWSSFESSRPPPGPSWYAPESGESATASRTGVPDEFRKVPLQRSPSAVMSLGEELPDWMLKTPCMPVAFKDDDDDYPDAPIAPPPLDVPTMTGSTSRAQPSSASSSSVPEQRTMREILSRGKKEEATDDGMFDSFESGISNKSSNSRCSDKPSTPKRGPSPNTRPRPQRRGASAGRRKNSSMSTESGATPQSSSYDDSSIFDSFDSVASGSPNRHASRPTGGYSGDGVRPPLNRSSTESTEASSLHDSFQEDVQVFKKMSRVQEEEERDTDEEFQSSFDSRASGARTPSLKNGIASMFRSSSNKRRAKKDISEGNAVIIFDWDDTLMPTTFIKETVIPTLRNKDEDPLTKESPYYSKFLWHAKVVEQLLRASTKVARVAIVTLATSYWVEGSASRFLPGLDFLLLLRELDINVYPADRQSPMVKEYAMSGKDPNRIAKVAAMSKCLKQTYHRGIHDTWNVLSVGDSLIEREALKECCSLAQKRQAICKTVKLREQLGVAELSRELQSVIPHLRQLINNEEDFDRTVGTLAQNGVRRFLRI